MTQATVATVLYYCIYCTLPHTSRCDGPERVLPESCAPKCAVSHSEFIQVKSSLLQQQHNTTLTQKTKTKLRNSFSSKLLQALVP